MEINRRLCIILGAMMLLGVCAGCKSPTNVESASDIQVTEALVTETSKESILDYRELAIYDVAFEDIYTISDSMMGLFVYADDGVYKYTGDDKMCSDGTHWIKERDVKLHGAKREGDRWDFYTDWVDNDSFWDNKSIYWYERSSLEELKGWEKYYYNKYVYNHLEEDILYRTFDRLPYVNYQEVGGVTQCIYTYEGARFMVLQIDQDALDVVVEYTIETPDGASIDKMTVSIRNQVMVHTTADHTYYFGVPEDDPSNTYVDVAPTYTLVLDEIYEVVKEEMVGNIKFYNGALITNDQKLYLVKKK